MDFKTKISPKKSLGQNFLNDESVLFDIVEAIDPKPSDTIVEIGPGHGALTIPLLESGAKVIGIEKDEKLAMELKTNFSKITIIEGDALEIFANSKNYKLLTKNYKLVGNIPYYITGHLFRIVSEIKNKPSLIVFMIQKEVAERICAPAGKTNLLSASIQVWAEPEIVRFVSRDSFNPRPKVDSAVIRLVPKLKAKSYQLQAYYSLLRIVFKQPRKTILNNLKQLTIGNKQITQEEILDLLKKNDIDPKARPQDLSVEDLSNLSQILE